MNWTKTGCGMDGGAPPPPPPPTPNDACSVYINGTVVEVLRGSLIIEKRIEERNIASFVVVDELANKVYLWGMPVKIYDLTPTVAKQMGKGEFFHHGS